MSGTSAILIAVVLLGAAVPVTAETLYESLDKVCLHADSGWVDVTAQAGNSLPLDVPLATTGTAGTHAALLGHHDIFDTLRIKVGQAGIGGALIWRYWDGDSFQPLQLTGPANLNAEGYTTVTFTVPADWALNTSWRMCAQGHYYVKVTTNDPYDVIPIADQMWTPGTPPVTIGGLSGEQPLTNNAGSPDSYA